MTTIRPSAAPWADGPMQLMKAPDVDVNAHPAYKVAVEMAHAHNALIRGLNSIILQSPHVPSADRPLYVEKDVVDLCFYVQAWLRVVHHHHHAEESTFFPMINELTGDADFMLKPKTQHEAFEGGMHKLEKYAAKSEIEPKTWRWQDMKSIINSFSDALTLHLHEEIDIMLDLHKLDAAGVGRAWTETERVAQKADMKSIYDTFPCILGICDKTFDNGNEFPPIPSLVSYAIKYWFAAGSLSGPWRFNPCTYWGKPVPLHFLPANRGLEAGV